MMAKLQSIDKILFEANQVAKAQWDKPYDLSKPATCIYYLDVSDIRWKNMTTQGQAYPPLG